MINPVEKILIVVPKHYRDHILDAIAQVGFVQIDPAQDNTSISLEEESEKKILKKIQETQFELAKIKFAITFLKTFDPNEKKDPLRKILHPRIPLTQKTFQKIIKEFHYEEVVRDAQNIESQFNEAKNQITSLKSLKEELLHWEKINLPISGQTQHFQYVFLEISKTSAEKFFQEMQKNLPLTSTEVASETKKSIFCICILKKTDLKRAREIFSQYSVSEKDLPKLPLTPREALEDCERKIKENTILINKLQKKAEKLAQYTNHLRTVYDYFFWRLQKWENALKLAETKTMTMIFGWIERDNIPQLKKAISNITNQFAVETLPLKKGEEHPIILKNSPLVQPFEMVTGIYGAPGAKDPDPTPFLAPFFILFFGLALTDAGYGIMLSLASWLGILLLKPTGATRKLLKVLFFGGVATFILGSFTGGYFGIALDNLPENTLQSLLLKIRIVDPLAEPIKVLLFSLFLGLIQLLFGLGVKVWWEIKQGNTREALLGPAMWIYFILSIGIWALFKNASGLIGTIVTIHLWLSIIAMIVTQGIQRKQKNILMKILSGIMSLYGIVGYLSDILSYSRLLALGLSTAIIAMVVNLIALLAKDMIPVVGWIFTVLILIGGHLFNIIINVLGAFIHSSRLQFVEFFPKFLVESGKIFQPFKKESKYTEIIPESSTTWQMSSNGNNS